MYLLLADYFESLLDKHSQVDGSLISWSLNLEVLEEDLSSKVSESFIDDILLLSLWHDLCWALECSLDWKDTDSAGCLDSGVSGPLGVVCHQS